MPLFQLISEYIHAFKAKITFKDDFYSVSVRFTELFISSEGIYDLDIVDRFDRVIGFSPRRVGFSIKSDIEYKSRHNYREITLYKHTTISQTLIDEIHNIELEMIAKNQQSLSSTTNTTTDTISGILSPIPNSNEINTINMSSSTNPVADLFPADVLDPARYTHYSSGPRRGYVEVPTSKPRKQYTKLKPRQQKAVLKQFNQHLETFIKTELRPSSFKTSRRHLSAQAATTTAPRNMSSSSTLKSTAICP